MTGPLVVSLGEPAGIGPEITVKAWRALKDEGPAFVAVGDAHALASAPGSAAGAVRPVVSLAEGQAAFAEALPVLDRPLAVSVVAGQPTQGAAAAVIDWIETAAGLALSGEARALVTAPIAKEALWRAGFRFPGHTEFLGALASGRGACAPVMMLVAADLRVSLVTIHEPLANVPSLISLDRIVATGLVTARALEKDFGIPHPRLAIVALNPHAGEGGRLGREEEEIIAPAVQVLADAGIAATGPHPADSLFHPEARARYDAAVCMYHDQALIPVKMLDFFGGVNLTVGLPIVRASPDHGVGLDIAGRGLARPESMIAALRMAARHAERRAALA